MVWEDGEECRLVKQEVVTGTAHKYGKVPHCAETLNGSICGGLGVSLRYAGCSLAPALRNVIPHIWE
eukprot:g11065.t1